MLLIDELYDIVNLTSASALVNVKKNSFFVQGHFPDKPIMPGVLILEALAQTGGILISKKGFNDKTALLLSVNNAKFRRPALPGDVLQLTAHGIHLSSKGGKIQAKALISGETAVEATIGFALRGSAQI